MTFFIEHTGEYKMIHEPQQIFSRKLTRKELQAIESYRVFMPDLEKACEMAKFNIDDFFDLSESNSFFKNKVEKIRLNFFSLAENELVSIIKNKDSTDNSKIMASKAILQYKRELIRLKV
jgi:hypothetical protein